MKSRNVCQLLQYPYFGLPENDSGLTRLLILLRGCGTKCAFMSEWKQNTVTAPNLCRHKLTESKITCDCPDSFISTNNEECSSETGCSVPHLRTFVELTLLLPRGRRFLHFSLEYFAAPRFCGRTILSMLENWRGHVLGKQGHCHLIVKLNG